MGAGCDPDAPVVLTVEGQQVGGGMSAHDGTFAVPIDMEGFGIGRYDVVAACGPVISRQLDLVLASRVEGSPSIFAVLAVFVLMGLLIVRGRTGSA